MDRIPSAVVFLSVGLVLGGVVGVVRDQVSRPAKLPANQTALTIIGSVVPAINIAGTCSNEELVEDSNDFSGVVLAACTEDQNVVVDFGFEYGKTPTCICDKARCVATTKKLTMTARFSRGTRQQFKYLCIEQG